LGRKSTHFKRDDINIRKYNRIIAMSSCSAAKNLLTFTIT